jgi:hypothetical protein
MDGGVRRKLEMAARVRLFSRSHPSTEPTYEQVLGRLEAGLARAEALAARQVTGRMKSREARVRRVELRREVHFQLLRYLVAVGSVAARNRVELAERFRLPDNGASNLGFLTAVKALLASAEEQREALVGVGMAPTLLEELGKKVAGLEAAAADASQGKMDHVGARSELAAITEELLEEVQVLDGINRWRYGRDPELMTEWNAARHVVLGPRRKTDEPPAGEGGSSPEPGQESPAA